MATEQEAKAKRCCGPHPCGIPDDSQGVNSAQRMCIGSTCMAWRWESQERFDEKWLSPRDAMASDSGFTNTEKADEMGFIRWVNFNEKIEAIGYCGLAGQP